MKILKVDTLKIPDIKIIHFAKYADRRGYFTEPYRKTICINHPDLKDCMKGVEFVQINESFSKAGVIRGLHFQWNPYMSKLVRTIHGHMIDLFLDIRLGSPTFGKIMGYDMPTSSQTDYGEWIWIPKGFAHGNLFLKDTTIEYLCTGEYSPTCEAGISPKSPDLDWSLCDTKLKLLFDTLANETELISDKDLNGLSLNIWKADERANRFIYNYIEGVKE